MAAPLLQKFLEHVYFTVTRLPCLAKTGGHGLQAFQLLAKIFDFLLQASARRRKTGAVGDEELVETGATCPLGGILTPLFDRGRC